MLINYNGVGDREGVQKTPVSLMTVMQVIGGTGILMVVVFLSSQVKLVLISTFQDAEMLSLVV